MSSEPTSRRSSAKDARDPAKDAGGPASNEATSSDTWWGRYRIPLDQLGLWRIGPLSLWVGRCSGEWRLAWETERDPLEPTVRVHLPAAEEDLLAKKDVIRFGVSSNDEQVDLVPRLADRPLISRPEKPFVVMPTDEITVYISTPVWVRVMAGPKQTPLFELPVYRPSDTWFGPDTMRGELCYAGRTAMRLNLEQLPFRAHRVTSAVTIRNRAREPITVEKLNLPVAHLTVYEGPGRELWTENILFERPADSDLIRLRLRDTVHHGAELGAVRISAPRLPLSDRLSVRALGSLFG
jgi:hypothetical protein